MQALILAAGYGSRLNRPLNLKPKSLLKIGKKTILYFIIKKLIASGIKKIHVVVGYKRELIKQYLLENFKKIKFNFIDNRFFKERGNIYSIHISKNIFKDDFIILNADLIIPGQILNKILKDRNKNIFLTNQSKFKTSDDILFLCNKSKIVKKVFVKEKVSLKNVFPASGIAKFSKKSLQKFSSLIKRMNLKNNKYYEDAYAKLTKDIKFKIVTSKKKIFELDTKEDYLIIKKIVRKNKIYL